jgi:hypothetical protein
MKGISFQKPFEIKVDIDGEKWRQGDIIQGQIEIKNLSNENLPTSNMGVAIASRKIKAKENDTFEIIQTHNLSQSDKFEFQLSENCPLTDKSSTLFLIYGDIESPKANLQLPILLHPYFQEIINVLDTFFRFKLKALKNGKNQVEASLLPATSREFATIDQLNIKFNFDNENVNLVLELKQKKLVSNDIGLGLKATNVKSSQKMQLTPKDYLLQKGMPNQIAIKAIFEKYLEQFKSKTF